MLTLLFACAPSASDDTAAPGEAVAIAWSVVSYDCGDPAEPYALPLGTVIFQRWIQYTGTEEWRLDEDGGFTPGATVETACTSAEVAYQREVIAYAP